MSYLLTEVAMEMLGWRFYDADGVARPMNFGGTNNEVCEGVENLAISLGCALPSNESIGSFATSVVQAEADSSSQIVCNASQVIDLDSDTASESEQATNYDDDDADDDNDDDGDGGSHGKDLADANIVETEQHETTNDSYPLHLALNTQNISILTDSNVTNVSKTSILGLKIQNVQSGYDIGKNLEALCKATSNILNAQQSQLSIVKVTSGGTDAQSDLMTQSPHEPSTSHNHLNNDFKTDKNVPGFIDLTGDDRQVLEIGQMLETEIAKIESDLNRRKSTYYAAIPNAIKYQAQSFQKVVETYRMKEYTNLQNELKNLQNLCKETEHKSYTNFEHNYPKYLDKCEKLSSRKRLSNAGIRIQCKDRSPVALDPS